MLSKRNTEEETLLEEKELNKGTYKLLLNLAVSVVNVNTESKLIPVVAKVIIRTENLDDLNIELDLKN